MDPGPDQSSDQVRISDCLIGSSGSGSSYFLLVYAQTKKIGRYGTAHFSCPSFCRKTLPVHFFSFFDATQELELIP